MSAPVRASDKDLRVLAAIVSQDRPDVPDGAGLPPSLLADLYDQIRCDSVVLVGFDGRAQARWFGQGFPPVDRPPDWEDRDRAYWTHYRASQFCSYPARTGDLRSIIKYSDFYSVRQHHSTAMYTDCDRPGTSLVLIPSLTTMATRPTTPAPTPAPVMPPVSSAWRLPDCETLETERDWLARSPSLACTRLSISMPIRSTSPSATAAS
jgi:hypothetical protein